MVDESSEVEDLSISRFRYPAPDERLLETRPVEAFAAFIFLFLVSSKSSKKVGVMKSEAPEDLLVMHIKATRSGTLRGWFVRVSVSQGSVIGSNFR